MGEGICNSQQTISSLMADGQLQRSGFSCLCMLSMNKQLNKRGWQQNPQGANFLKEQDLRMPICIKVLSIIYIRALTVFKFLPVTGDSASGHPKKRTHRTVRSKPRMLLILEKEH